MALQLISTLRSNCWRQLGVLTTWLRTGVVGKELTLGKHQCQQRHRDIYETEFWWNIVTCPHPALAFGQGSLPGCRANSVLTVRFCTNDSGKKSGSFKAAEVARRHGSGGLHDTSARTHRPHNPSTAGNDATIHPPDQQSTCSGAGDDDDMSFGSPTSNLRPAVGRSREAARPSSPELAGPSLTAVLGAMAGLVRGVGSTGLGAAVFGLQALARRHEAERLTDHPEGTPVAGGSGGVEAEAARLLDGLELAHGAYRKSAAALAATTCLRAKNVVVWRPEGGRLQPGYYLAVDHPGRRVVWGVRGTRVFSDLLTDLAMASHPLGPGEAHWGMTHAAHWLLQQEAARVGDLLRSLRPAGSFRLEVVGHSLGGAVAALLAMMLREGLTEAARAAAIPPESVSCLAFGPAAVMSPALAAQCRPYVTSVVLNNDFVPRFNAASLALLQEELQGVDWYAELQRTLAEHSMVKSISTTLGSLAPSLPGPAGAAAQPLHSTGTAASPAGGLVPALQQRQQQPASGAAVVQLQQLSAALLESAAFRSAIAALDDWKASAMAAAGEQAEAAVRRQADVIRGWLQDMASLTQPQGPAAAWSPQAGLLAALKGAADAAAALQAGMAPTGADSSSVGRTGEGVPPAAAQSAVPLLAPGWFPSPSMDDVRRAAEVAAERLKASVDAAVASLTAAAAASKDKISATLPPLPPLPSLPQPHELPLVEPRVAVAAVAKSASGDATGGAVGGLEAAAAAVGAAGWAGVPAWAAVGSGSWQQKDFGACGPPVTVPSKGQDFPLMLPPGRILYIKQLAAGVLESPEALPQRASDASDTAPRGANGAADTISRRRRPLLGTLVGSGRQYVLLELPPGRAFKRVILGRAAIMEHRCRAYRKVLMQMALQL